MSADILIIDDEDDIRSLIQGILEDEGYRTREAANDRQAYEQVADKAPDLVILDIWLQNSADDGLEILQKIKKKHPHVPVLMISGHGTIETAVSAIKYGAYDFIEKPFKSDRLMLMMERALETAALRQENEKLRSAVQGPSELIGEAPEMNAVRQALSRVAQSNSRVLITGEAGTGKDNAARFIHRHSQRSEKSFMVLNCAVMRPERFELELFGTAGEQSTRGVTGILERADGGTLFLDEVADMPLETQGKIVRVLQEQRFQRVGGQQAIEVDVRIIASSNRDLEKVMEEGGFRQDLFYRLNVVPIHLPPLRERLQDIAPLVAYFSESYSRQSGTPARQFSEAAIALLQNYEWPGNVRQLRNVVEWCMIMGGGSDSEIMPEQLPPEVRHVGGSPQQDSFSVSSLVSLSLRDAREKFETDYLAAQLKRFGYNISKTASFVGMERSALHRKMKQLGLSATGRDESAPGHDHDPAQSTDGKRA